MNEVNGRHPQTLNRLSILLVFVLAVGLYGRALQFGFFNDDPTGHFNWMAGQSYWRFFSSSAGYGYYRPVVFASLKLLHDIFGGYFAPGFHAFLLFLHGTNVAMVWLLAWHLGQRRDFAWLAALAFAAMPFSYEAVAYVASLTHPLVTFWLLLTLLLYRQARLKNNIGYFAAAFLTLFLGLFSHENGLFISLALAGMDWLLWPPHKQDWWKRPFLPYFIPATLYFILWFTIPKAGEQSLPTISRLIANLIPTLQTLVYPILPLFQLDAGDTILLFVASAAFTLVTYLLARKAQSVSLWLFALGWIVCSAAPSILVLNSDYLYGSPRLHYLPSIGVALLWGLPLLAIKFNQKVVVLRILIPIVYLLAVALPPLPFINCQMDFYARTSQIVHQMGQVGVTAPPERELIFANLPYFFSSYDKHPDGCPNPYPWTPVGAVVIPPYAQARDFVRFNGGPDRPVTAVTIPDYTPGWNTYGPDRSLAEIREELPDTAVYVFNLSDGDFFDLTNAWQPDAAISQPEATFGNEISLIGAQVNRTADEIEVVADWQVLKEGERPLTVFVHLYDSTDALVAQHDGPPAQGFVPWPFWQPGDIIIDRHAIPLPAPLASGNYQLAVGMYDSNSGERLAGMTGSAPLPDNIYVLEQFTTP
ncbi:MAG: hypothetical protein H6667_08245 [Ardenticatenaceae bacterium]|nr:hypothetical protein [Ardenticatenaceae bacterium]MCB9444711.1 hypothetical protein [Ardenticatenaceae bacterium]